MAMQQYQTGHYHDAAESASRALERETHDEDLRMVYDPKIATQALRILVRARLRELYSQPMQSKDAREAWRAFRIAADAVRQEVVKARENACHAARLAGKDSPDTDLAGEAMVQTTVFFADEKVSALNWPAPSSERGLEGSPPGDGKRQEVRTRLQALRANRDMQLYGLCGGRPGRLGNQAAACLVEAKIWQAHIGEWDNPRSGGAVAQERARVFGAIELSLRRAIAQRTPDLDRILPATLTIEAARKHRPFLEFAAAFGKTPEELLAFIERIKSEAEATRAR
ncbi:MAG TPA: hypothetical protein VHA82_13055 [Ramlibacter sp.]|uniref:hypothetical protein n=1 Tax=Ramlibacter sp. TaxID=1917967 RepID=UPI002BE5E2E4|nr:hypothetical protein [Ramlibacter sp.]HVZ44731.1 hypothetical protein [Ramlibacter sp.]